MQKVLASGEKEIVSRSLGESVMAELKKLDKVAYIRFASVYRSFSDVEDFNNVIKDLD
jgi:transcriptional repressor NrdR